jgi:hypothetical protein
MVGVVGIPLGLTPDEAAASKSSCTWVVKSTTGNSEVNILSYADGCLGVAMVSGNAAGKGSRFYLVHLKNITN